MGDEFAAGVSRARGLALAVLLTAAPSMAGCGVHRAAQERVAQAQARNAASANDGARLYITNCSSCHQLDGRGVPGAFPPLAGNPVVTGDPRRLLEIVTHGQRGPTVVEGQRYGGEMPAWHGLLSGDEIAAVVTYIRGAWRNNAGAVPQDAAY